MDTNMFIYIGGIVVVFIGIAGFTILRNKKMVQSNNEFLNQHPDAARLYLFAKSSITDETVEVHAVDDAKPEVFSEKMKSGIYLAPGTHTLRVSYSYTRPGLAYKTVTKSTDQVSKEVTVEANKSYILGYERKEERFTFSEYTE